MAPQPGPRRRRIPHKPVKTLLASLILVHLALGAALAYTASTSDPGNLAFTLLVAYPVLVASLWLSAPHLMTALVLGAAAAILLAAHPCTSTEQD